MKKNILIPLLVVAFFSVWLGIPAFNKWRADKLVDELCAKDGGIKVYETVTLPKQRFNQWGQFEVSSERYVKSGEQYYLAHETTDIEGKSASTNIGALAVFKQHFKIFRIADKKLLGDATIYARTGGDSIGPWHPSSHSCPKNPNLEAAVFLKSE